MSDLETRTRARIALLKSAADLYDEMADALTPVCERRYALYTSENVTQERMIAVRTATDARDEYRRLAKDNRIDVAVLEELLETRVAA